VWSPYLKQDIHRLEKVQRRFTKRLANKKHLSYTERLVSLELPSLELRRLHADLIYCYKIVFGHVDLKFEDFFEYSPVSVMRGHAYKLYNMRCSSKIRNNFFDHRVVNTWNHLPRTVDFRSLHSFKCSIAKVDFSSFLTCDFSMAD